MITRKSKNSSAVSCRSGISAKVPRINSKKRIPTNNKMHEEGEAREKKRVKQEEHERLASSIRSSKMFQEQIDDLNKKLQFYNPEKEALKTLDLFVLDNSLRETTVGQLRGHTIEDKWRIFEQVKKVGYKNIIVESFNHQTRVGDKFIHQLIEKGEDMAQYWAFSEFLDSVDENKVPQEDIVPIGLLKCKEYGIHNVMMELDLVYYGINYKVFKMKRLCQLLSKRFEWIRENISPNSRIFVNIRDFSNCMLTKPRRMFKVVNYLSSLPESERIFGIAYEESGDNLPEQLKVWTTCVRQEMNKCGWNNGHLIVHVHERFGCCDWTNMECLASGATGVWAGLCELGAMMGHASSTLAIVHLIKIGNKKVLQKFNCNHLRTASRTVTEIVTTKPPHPTQPVCGERALDLVFGLEPLTADKNRFDIAEFFGEKNSIRITTLASPTMIVLKLEEMFGKHESFTLEVAAKMKDLMLDDLRDNRKEEYNSEVGLAMLFDRAGGKLTGAMADAIEKSSVNSKHMQRLIDEIREMWNVWDVSNGQGDDKLEFFAFYNGFMAAYFGCYRCDEARKALQCIDMDEDGTVDWKEFCVYLKWAAREYPDTNTAEELLGIAFQKGIVPAMQDELLKEVPHSCYHDDHEEGDFYPELPYHDSDHDSDHE